MGRLGATVVEDEIREINASKDLQLNKATFRKQT